MPNLRLSFQRRWHGLSPTAMSVIILCQGLVAGIHAYILCDPIDHVYSDMGGYISRAWKVSIGETLTADYFFYPPGTGYFFSLFFAVFGFAWGLSVIKFVQVLLLALCTELLGMVCWRCYRRQWLTYAVMLASVFYVPFSAQASFFMAEAIFCYLLLCALYLLVRPLDEVPFFLLGLVLSLATLVKGQALALVGTALCVVFFHVLFRRRTWHCLPALLLGLAIPLIVHWSIISKASGSYQFFIGANDSFNMYLGQSRHKALGALDRKDGSYFVFHNNNAGLEYPFKHPSVLFRGIDDRSAFRKDVSALWRRQTSEQLLISLQNIVELFSINPRWPQRNVTLLARMDVFAQWAFLILITIPAICTVLSRRKIKTSSLAVFSLPLLFVTLICALTMGQPRYLLPFHYCLLLLAGGFYLELELTFKTLFRSQRL